MSTDNKYAYFKSILKYLQKNTFIFLILIPFLDFIRINFEKILFQQIVELSLIYFAILIGVKLLSFLTIKKPQINLILSPNNFGIFFLLFFFHSSLKQYISFEHLNSEIALILIVILAIFLIFLINYKKNKFLSLFISFYIILSLFNNIYIITSKKIKSLNTSSAKYSAEIKKNFKNHPIKKKTENNIYLIVIDEATSIDEFDRIYNNQKGHKFLDEIKEFNYKYIKDSYSSYNQTELTFSSYFHMNYFITDQSKRYYDTKNFYPQILKYNYLDLPLIKILNENNYKFYFFGNTRGDCYINKKTCLKNYKIENKIFSEVSEIFFIKSAFYPIYKKIEERVRRLLKIPLYNDNYYQNDAIQKFIDTTRGKIPRQSFFLLHNFYPHAPYIYNEDCSENKKNIQASHIKNVNLANKDIGYYKNYLCSLKKVKKIIKYLNKYDPEALVIIQSDHGKYFDVPKNKKQKLKQFNLIKKLDKCKKKINKNIDNVNSIRYALNCQLDLNLKILEKSSYWGPYSTREKNYGKLEKIILN